MRTLVTALALVASASAFSLPSAAPTGAQAARRARLPQCVQTPPPDLEEVTKKYGLEAGLFSALKRGASKNKDSEEDGDAKTGAMATAGDLLKRYGGAYLLTSTSLAVVSFSLCYAAVSNGVDVASLLQKIGIEVCARTLCFHVFLGGVHSRARAGARAPHAS